MSRSGWTQLLIGLAVIGISQEPVRADECTSQKEAVTSIRARIKTDQGAISRINPELTLAELDKWTEAAKEERAAILLDSLLSTAGTLAGAVGERISPENALKPWTIAGYRLPNGIASLGTGQANAVIGRLQRAGLSQTTRGRIAIASIRELSTISNKKDTLEFLSQLQKTFAVLKGGTNVQMADDSVESATAMLELIADLAGKGDFYVSLSSALFEGMVKDPFDWYVMSKTVNSLSDSTDQQLIALKSASANLSRNVQTLQEQKLAVAACEKLAKGPSVKDMSRSQYELERKRLYALVLQALDVVSACRAKWQSCWNSCTSQPNPSADKCWQKCGNCDADQASWDTAMQRVYAFDKEWSASH